MSESYKNMFLGQRLSFPGPLLDGIPGLVAVNSLSAMVAGIIAALLVSRGDPGFLHNGALAGLGAICAGSDILHPVGAFAIGLIGSVIFV